MGARRVLALTRGLPPDSALARSINPEAAAWGNTEELLAVLAELIDHGNRLLFSVNRGKGTRIPEPIKIRRPGSIVEDIKRAPASHAEVIAFFGAVS